MAVEVFKDPRTRKEVTFVSGKIEGVFFNKLKNVETYSGPNGPWTPTHTVNVIVDGTRIGFGLTDKDVINSKDVDGEYHSLSKGMEVSVEITEIGEYNGKPQYKSKASKVTVLDATADTQQQKPSGSSQKPSGGFKKDMSGVHTGHAINVAINVLSDLEDAEAIVAAAKEAHTLTQRLKKEYAEKNPNMSEYDVGASVGQAVLSASHYVEVVGDIEGYARRTLDFIVPEVMAFVKESDKSEVKSSTTQKKSTKKTVAKKTTKKQNASEESPIEDSDIPESAFEDLEDDSDIPF